MSIRRPHAFNTPLTLSNFMKKQAMENTCDKCPHPEKCMKANKCLKKSNSKEADSDSDKRKDKDPCWDSHKQIGWKMKDGKKVPNCVPKEEAKEGNAVKQAALPATITGGIIGAAGGAGAGYGMEEENRARNALLGGLVGGVGGAGIGNYVSRGGRNAISEKKINDLADNAGMTGPGGKGIPSGGPKSVQEAPSVNDSSGSVNDLYDNGTKTVHDQLRSQGM